MKNSLVLPPFSKATALRLLTLLLLAFGVASCRHTADVPTRAYTPAIVSTNSYAFHKTEIEPLKGKVSTAFVHIDGDDIQLPLTSGPSSPQENRIYSFYIWAYDPELSSQKTLMEMMGKEFSLEVIGANAKYVTPSYMPSDPNGKYKKMFPDADEWFLQSRNVIEIQVSSKDINRSFSILAWFPQKAAEYQTKQVSPEASKENPYIARKDVRVFNGDLRTSIQIVGPEEVSASFGRHFHKYFYVGRVFFRNRHQDKRLMVYTTSMRANVLMYRKQGDEVEKQRPLSEEEKQKIRQRVNSMEAVLPKGLQGMCIDAAMAARPLPPKGLEDETQKLVGKILQDKEQRKLWLRQEPRLDEDKLRSKCVETVRRTFELINQEIMRLALHREKLANYLADELKQLDAARKETEILTRVEGADLDSLLARISKLTIKSPSLNPVSDIDEAEKVLRLLGGMKAEQRDKLETALKGVRHTLADIDVTEWLKQRLIAPNAKADAKPIAELINDDKEKSLLDIKVRIRHAAMVSGQLTPMDQVQMIRVNPSNNALAFSQDADMQRAMLENGMLWQDYYRPMTFQAVLNSLIFVHDNSWETKTVKFMESAARVAGGLAAMGTVFNELSSRGYTEGVNVFSTILMPEVSKQLLEDINKSIRNLGDLGMDTVVVIPPNGVVDRYIFFPKGPIYNFVDEFNISDPGYIVRVDSSDVSAEALLIDQDTPVQAGELDSKTLVSRAINEGKASEAAEIMKKAALEDKLRRFDLMTLAADVENLLGNTPVTDPNAAKTPERLEKERQVILMVRDFENKHGPDQTGLIASLMRKYSVEIYSQPPVFALLEAIHLPEGFKSKAVSLPVTDEHTMLWNLKPSVVTNTNTKLVSSENIKWDYPTRNEPHPLRLQVVSEKLETPDEVGRALITLQIENDAGRKATNNLEIIVHPVAMDVSLGNDKAGNGVITIADKNEVKTLRLEMPFYQATTEGLEIALESTDKSISVLSTQKAVPMLVPEKGGEVKLRAEWRVDTSLLPDKAAANGINGSFSIKLLPGKGLSAGSTITTNFNIKLKAP